MNQFWRNGAVTGVTLFLEASAFYVLFTIVAQVLGLPEIAIPFWLTLLALLCAFLASLYVQTTRFSLNVRGVAGVTISALSLLLLVNLNTNIGLASLGGLVSGQWGLGLSMALSLIFLVVMWWRGGVLAHDDVTLDSMKGSFQWGLVVILSAVLIEGLTALQVINGFLIVGFFGVGLFGLSLARFSSEAGDGGVSRNWLTSIAAIVGGILALGLLISALGIGGLDDVTRSLLGLVGAGGLLVLKPIFLGLGYLAAGLVEMGNWMSGLFGGGDLSNLEVAQERIREFHESLETEGERGPPWVLVAILKGTAFLGGLALTVWLLFRIFRFRRFLRGSKDVEEVRESTFSWDRANQDLSALLREWWNEMLGKVDHTGGRWPNPRNAREAYHGLLRLAGEVGRPRKEWETPREHQRNLRWLLPPGPVGRIVDGFEVSYYGHREVTGPELEDLLGEWASLRRAVEEPEDEGPGGAPDPSRP